MAAGDDGRFDTTPISDLPAATALTGVELLSGLQDLDAVKMTTDQLNGTPVTTKRGLGLNFIRGYSDFSNTASPLSMTTNGATWGVDPYIVRSSGGGSRVNQGSATVQANFFQPAALLFTGVSNPSGYAGIRSTQTGLVLLATPQISMDTQFSVADVVLGGAAQSHKTRIGFFDQNFVNILLPVNGMYFEYVGDGSNPNWQAVVALTPYGGGTNTVDTVDTGVPVTANLEQVFRVFFNKPELKTEFFIDGVLVATILDSALSQARPLFTAFLMEVQVVKSTGNVDANVAVYHHKYSVEKPPLEHY